MTCPSKSATILARGRAVGRGMLLFWVSGGFHPLCNRAWVKFLKSYKMIGVIWVPENVTVRCLEYPNFDCNFLSAKCMMVMFFKSLSGQPGKSQIDLLYWRFLIHLMSGLSLHVGQNSSVCKQPPWIVLSHYVEEGRYQEMEQTNKLGTWGVYNHRYSLQIIVRCFFTLMILIWLSLRMTDMLIGDLLDSMKDDWASCLES